MKYLKKFESLFDDNADMFMDITTLHGQELKDEFNKLADEMIEDDEVNTEVFGELNLSNIENSGTELIFGFEDENLMMDARWKYTDGLCVINYRVLTESNQFSDDCTDVTEFILEIDRIADIMQEDYYNSMRGGF